MFHVIPKGMFRRELLEHEPAKPDDHGHHVVDFMGDAAGQFPYGLEPPRLGQLFLHPLMGADLTPGHETMGMCLVSEVALS